MEESRRAVGAFLGVVILSAVTVMGVIIARPKSSPWHDWVFLVCAAVLVVSVGLIIATVRPEFVGWLGGRARDSRPPTVSYFAPKLARNPSFTGRAALLRLLKAKLARAGRRTVVLHGDNGVGKTQLAFEYANKFHDKYDIVGYISAEEPSLIIGVAALAQALGFAPPDQGGGLVQILAQRLPFLRKEDDLLMQAADKLRVELANHKRWLLVFDDASGAADVQRWLPAGNFGHVLITTTVRGAGWGQLAATPIEVKPFKRSESVKLLHRLGLSLTRSEADALAKELCDQPLGLVQAADHLAKSSMLVDNYLAQLRADPVGTLDKGRSINYKRTLSVALGLNRQRLADADQTAAELVSVSAFMAAEPIPIGLFTAQAGKRPSADPLSRIDAAAPAWQDTLAALRENSLVQVDDGVLQMQRLIQTILRGQPAQGQAAGLERARKLLAAGRPADTSDPAHWAEWDELLPHVWATKPEESADPDVRDLACEAIRYLLNRGNTDDGRQPAERIYQQWTLKLGINDPQTLSAASNVALAFAQDGNYEEAQFREQDVYDRRRVLGADLPATLKSATDLAYYLRMRGRYEEARRLDSDTLARRSAALGADDPDTLTSASNLAADLAFLNQLDKARKLAEDTYERRKKLGDDRLDTLNSANNLAIDRAQLGEFRSALALTEDVFERRVRVQGRDHRDTLATATFLAMMRSELKMHRQAIALAKDTLARQRHALGVDHPYALLTASNLAEILYNDGKAGEAAELAQDTLDRFRARLGEDYPDTIDTAYNLLQYLNKLHRTEEAGSLDQDIRAHVGRVLGKDFSIASPGPADLAEYRRRWAEQAVAGPAGSNESTAAPPVVPPTDPLAMS